MKPDPGDALDRQQEASECLHPRLRGAVECMSARGPVVELTAGAAEPRRADALSPEVRELLEVLRGKLKDFASTNPRGADQRCLSAAFCSSALSNLLESATPDPAFTGRLIAEFGQGEHAVRDSDPD